MILFKKKKNPKEPEPTFTHSVPYSENFKGFKRVRLDSYQDVEADKGIQATKTADTIDMIMFKEYRFPGVNPLIRVYADENKLGTLWSSSHPAEYKAVLQRKVKCASVGFNGTNDAFLFIKC